jgi:hypothetical protein
MYGQLTVGKPLHIISRVKGETLASEMFVSIDTARNQPDIDRKKQLRWDRPHGTLVEMELEGHFQKGPHSVEAYLKRTAIANPHVAITYRDPGGEEIHIFAVLDPVLVNRTPCRDLLLKVGRLVPAVALAHPRWWRVGGCVRTIKLPHMPYASCSSSPSAARAFAGAVRSRRVRPARASVRTIEGRRSRRCCAS